MTCFSNKEMKHTAYSGTAEILRSQLREAVLDHEAFEQKVVPCVLSTCRATCCHDGVYLSREEARGIQDLIAEVVFDGLPAEPILSVRGGKALKTATRPAELGELAEDYPAHFPQTRCVFLDREGRCGIQSLSMQQGRHAWFDKPLTCWIHPIVILPVTRERPRPVLTLVTPENDPQQTEGYPGFASCTHCGRPDEAGIPARVALKAELEMLGLISGRDVLGELNAKTARSTGSSRRR